MNKTSTPQKIVEPLVRPWLGFLGVGWIGRNRMEALARSGLVQVVAIADPVKDTAESAAAGVGAGVVMEDDLADLLTHDLDGIVIATPSAVHAEQAETALEAGVAVFCQKPLGRTAAENRRVVDAARAADRLLGVDLSYRHVNGMKRIHEAIAAGQIGKVFAVDLVFHNAYGPDKPWYYDLKRSGGGCVMDLGIHLVDLALWALGYPAVTEVNSRLYAAGELLSGAPERVEDYAVACLDLENSTTLNLACSWRLNAGCDAVIAATFHGTAGGLTLHNLKGSFYALTAELLRGTAREPLGDVDEEWGGRAALAWARQLAQGNRFDPTVETIIDVAAALDLIYGR